MSLEEKKREVEHLHDELSATPHAILVDFRGLDVAGATDLRRRLHDEDAKFRVVKNSIALRAIEDLPLAELRDSFQGQTAIAYTGGDVVVLAKTLREFAREFETPTFKAGVVDGEPITVEEFESIAELPSRDELIGRALWLMQYPVSGLVTALNGIVRGFVVALDQVRDKKESGELPAGEPEPAEAEAAETEPAETETTETEAAETEAAETEAAGAEAPEAEAADDEGAAAEEPDEETGGEAAAGAAGAEEPDEAAEAAGTGEPDEEIDEAEDAEASAAGAEEAKQEAAESDEEAASPEEEEREESKE